MNLGGKIREARIRRQMTQKDVVGEYMTRNMLSKIENGSATPSVKTLEYLAEALSIPASALLGDEGAEPRADSEHLKAITLLADGLLAREDRASYTEAAALCIKARVMLAEGDPGTARALLDEHREDGFDADGKRLIYMTLEDCCKAQDDYKSAYEYAYSRLESV